EGVLGPHGVLARRGEGHRIAFEVLGPGSGRGKRSEHVGRICFIDLVDRQNSVTGEEEAVAPDGQAAVRTAGGRRKARLECTRCADAIERPAHVRTLVYLLVDGVPGDAIADVQARLSVEEEGRRP